MHGREAMLEKIRKALGRSSSGTSEAGSTPLPELGVVLPPIGFEHLIPKLEEEIKSLAGNCHRASSKVELSAILAQILNGSGTKSLVLSRNPLLCQLDVAGMVRQLGRQVIAWPEGEMDATAAAAFREALFQADVGITGVTAALAESGSLVLTSQTEGAQLASLAPPVHIALYRREQVVESLEEVLEKLPVSVDPNTPSLARSVVFVTGTSRTADIEQILVRGVHGPGALHAILVEDSCFG